MVDEAEENDLDKDLETILLLLLLLVEVVEGLVHRQREGEGTHGQVDAVEEIEEEVVAEAEEAVDGDRVPEEGSQYPIFLLLTVS